MLREIYSRRNLIIYEQSPTKRSIVIGRKRIFLDFPYLVFIIRKKNNYYSLMVYASKDKINNNLNNNLYTIPVIATGFVCISKFQKLLDKKDNLFKRFMNLFKINYFKNISLQIIDYYWQSNWGSEWECDINLIKIDDDSICNLREVIKPYIIYKN